MNISKGSTITCVLVGFLVVFCEAVEIAGLRENEKKGRIAEEAIVPIVPQIDTRIVEMLQQQALPKGLAEIIVHYMGAYEDGMRIAYANRFDTSYVIQTKMLDPLGCDYLFGPSINWHVFGAHECLKLPLVRQCYFSGMQSHIEHRQPLWDYTQIGAMLCPDRARVLSWRIDDSWNVAPWLKSGLADLLYNLLVAATVTAKVYNDKAVIQAQQSSLFCTAPGIGPRQFAQLLKNSVLELIKERERRGKHFEVDDKVFGPDCDTLIERFDRYRSTLDQVINDSTGTLILCFEGRNKHKASELIGIMQRDLQRLSYLKQQIELIKSQR